MHNKDRIFIDTRKPRPGRPFGSPNENTEQVSRAKGRHSFPWLLLIVGLLVGIVGGFYLRPLVMPAAKANAAAPVAIQKPGQPAAAQRMAEITGSASNKAAMETVLANVRHFDGDPDAPITLVEFGDFRCGYCGKWARETLPLIQQNYIEPGKVRLAYINYPILGAESMTAAEASECAAQQDKFWEYHQQLYENQRMGFTPENLTDLARELDLDTGAFAQCLSDFPDQTALENDVRLGQAMGVRGTPNFLVNGVAIPGALPYQQFEQVIEALLAEESQ